MIAQCGDNFAGRRRRVEKVHACMVYEAILCYNPPGFNVHPNTLPTQTHTSAASDHNRG